MNKLRLVPGGVDAIIVDIGLPDRKGDELVREIKAVNPALPIILATGQSARTVRERFKNEGNVGIVTKPYTASDLLRALRDVGIRWNPR